MASTINLKAPGDTRPTWLNGVIQVHITRACDLACVSCTQGSNLAGKPVMMSLENFEKAVISLKDYYGVVGIFGGNPTLHPKFEEICEILAKHIPFERRGLWSNNLHGYGKLCREIFNPAYSNLNVHTSQAAYDEMKRDWPECNPIGTQDSRHSPPFVAINDMVNLDEDSKVKLIESCDINKFWSAMICQFRGELRGFFCELAGAQSMLHENEPDYPDTGLRIHENWWKAPIINFQHQIKKHCFECGIPLRGRGDLAVQGNTEYVSKTHLPIYNLKKKQGKELKVVEKIEDLNGFVPRATDYIQNGLNVNKVLIGLPTAEMARRADFYDYYNQIIKPEGTLFLTSHGQSPARGRNLIIEEALKIGATHILFLDDDTAPPPDILVKLLAHDKDIVTGLYLMRNFPHAPIIFNHADEEGRCTHMFPPDGMTGLVEIVATGLGACLIKTDVFRRMQAPWITLGELEKDHWCDDIAFFRRVRQLGIKMYCDLDVQVGHMAQLTIFPRYMDGQWLTCYNTNGTSEVRFNSIKPAPVPVGA